MTTYKCRVIKPSVSQWFDVNADTPELAARDFHYDKLGLIPGVRFKPDATRPGLTITFARIEVDGHGELVSRVWECRLVRKGGVRRPGIPLRIEDVAKVIGWEHDTQELLTPGWDGEEEHWS